MRRITIFAVLCGMAQGFVPMPPLATCRHHLSLQASRSNGEVSRTEALVQGLVSAGGLAGAFTILPQLARAEDAVSTEVGAAPEDFTLSRDYYKDANKMVQHMKYATFMNRDTPNYESIAKAVKGEMTDFVSYYRRYNTVAGKPSFSTLYTAVNVMAGHYASYGPKFPIPEKRRKRLMQEFTEIERNIKRGR